MRFASLNLRDKIGIARALVVMLRAKTERAREDLDMGAWLKAQGQTEQAVRRFWRPILVSACNEEPERISCLHAFKLFRDGFLLNSRAFHFGVPRVPLGTLYTEPTLAYLQKRGSCVRTRTIVDKIHFSEDSNPIVTGLTLRDGERIEADFYVSGLQFDLLLKLLPERVTQDVPYWENLRQIELCPILGAHLWFDRPIDCPPALAILDRSIEWIFNKTQNWNLPPEQGTYLSIVISASQRFADMPKEELTSLVLKEARECLPDAQQANVTKSLVIRWPKATLSPRPGVEALRPDQRSPIANLYVAGEWTQTGWPSTMEGGVRSGYRAAEYLLAHEGNPQTLLAPDLPAQGIARFFA